LPVTARIGAVVFIFSRAEWNGRIISDHEQGRVDVDGVEAAEREIVSGAQGGRQVDARPLPATRAGRGVSHGMDNKLGGPPVFGYAGTRDLVHWSEEQAVPVTENDPTAVEIGGEYYPGFVKLSYPTGLARLSRLNGYLLHYRPP
jgi:hypothetical protein